MSIEIDVSELNTLGIGMGDVKPEAMAAARTAAQKFALGVKTDSKAMAPVDTGNLRNSISYETAELATAVTAEIGPTANYGAYVEFGTSRNAPAAYMGPAFDRQVPALVEALEQIAGQFLD